MCVLCTSTYHAAVAYDVGCFRLQLLECLQSSLGVGFLPHADNGVEHQDEEDHKGLDVCAQPSVCVAFCLFEIREHKGDDRCEQQDLLGG